jgi:hypothetical protein
MYYIFRQSVVIRQNVEASRVTPLKVDSCDCRRKMQGVRIQLNAVNIDWAQRALANLDEAQGVVGVVAGVMLETVGPELKVRAVDTSSSVEFEAGSPVTLTRDVSKDLSATLVPVQCELPFTALRLRPNAQLCISAFLALGELPATNNGSTIWCSICSYIWVKKW